MGLSVGYHQRMGHSCIDQTFYLAFSKIIEEGINVS